MLYILGGAPRSGKTLLSRRAVSEKQIPYVPLDGIVTALAYGAPQVGVTFDMQLTDRAASIWPITRELLGFFLREERDFLIEGDSVVPSQVHELASSGAQIKACFLGYPNLNTGEKLVLIRKYHQGESDWTKDIGDEEMGKMVDEMIEFSKYLESECLKFGIRYFDISHDFDNTREEAFVHLFA